MYIIYLYMLGLALNLYAGSGVFVELLAVHLTRAVHGGKLLISADVGLYSCLYIRLLGKLALISTEYIACYVLGVRHSPKQHNCLILLYAPAYPVYILGSSAHCNRKHALRHRIKRACMSRLPDSEDMSQLRAHIHGCPSGFLIYIYKAIISVKLLHF